MLLVALPLFSWTSHHNYIDILCSIGQAPRTGMELSKDLVAASATPMLLSILSSKESYGYEIIQRVKDLSGGRLAWNEGMLYPVLHRLEKRGYVSSRWQDSEKGPRRKYYRLTRRGNAVLGSTRQQWDMVNQTLSGLWTKKTELA